MLEGRGISIYNNGPIIIAYYEDGWHRTGNYIAIDKGGNFDVGKFYFKDGIKWRRGTQYFKDGTERKYDY
jgi:hypothetical protein